MAATVEAVIERTMAVKVRDRCTVRDWWNVRDRRTSRQPVTIVGRGGAERCCDPNGRDRDERDR